jgi:hypothetical protein
MRTFPLSNLFDLCRSSAEVCIDRHCSSALVSMMYRKSLEAIRVLMGAEAIRASDPLPESLLTFPHASALARRLRVRLPHAQRGRLFVAGAFFFTFFAADLRGASLVALFLKASVALGKFASASLRIRST